jgi:hypothetical protein
LLQRIVAGVSALSPRFYDRLFDRERLVKPACHAAHAPFGGDGGCHGGEMAPGPAGVTLAAHPGVYVTNLLWVFCHAERAPDS